MNPESVPQLKSIPKNTEAQQVVMGELSQSLRLLTTLKMLGKYIPDSNTPQVLIKVGYGTSIYTRSRRFGMLPQVIGLDTALQQLGTKPEDIELPLLFRAAQLTNTHCMNTYDKRFIESIFAQIGIEDRYSYGRLRTNSDEDYRTIYFPISNASSTVIVRVIDKTTKQSSYTYRTEEEKILEHTTICSILHSPNIQQQLFSNNPFVENVDMHVQKTESGVIYSFKTDKGSVVVSPNENSEFSNPYTTAQPLQETQLHNTEHPDINPTHVVNPPVKRIGNGAFSWLSKGFGWVHQRTEKFKENMRERTEENLERRRKEISSSPTTHRKKITGELNRAYNIATRSQWQHALIVAAESAKVFVQTVAFAVAGEHASFPLKRIIYIPAIPIFHGLFIYTTSILSNVTYNIPDAIHAFIRGRIRTGIRYLMHIPITIFFPTPLTNSYWYERFGVGKAEEKMTELNAIDVENTLASSKDPDRRELYVSIAKQQTTKRGGDREVTDALINTQRYVQTDLDNTRVKIARTKSIIQSLSQELSSKKTQRLTKKIRKFLLNQVWLGMNTHHQENLEYNLRMNSIVSDINHGISTF